MAAQQKMPSQTKSFQTFECSENGFNLTNKNSGHNQVYNAEERTNTQTE